MITSLPTLLRHAQIRTQLRTLIAAFAAASTLATAGLAQADNAIASHYNLPARVDPNKATSDRRSGNPSNDRDGNDRRDNDRNTRPVFVPNPVNDRRDNDRNNHPVFVPNPVNDRRDDRGGNRDYHPVNNGRDRDDRNYRNDNRHDNDNWKVAAGVGLGLVIGAAIGSHNHHEAPPPTYYPNTDYRPVYRDSCPVHNDYYSDNSNYGYYNYDGGGYHQDGYQSGYGEDSLTGVVMERVGESEFFIRHGYDRIHIVMNRRLPGTFSCGDSIFLRGSFSGDTFYAFDVDITHNV